MHGPSYLSFLATTKYGPRGQSWFTFWFRYWIKAARLKGLFCQIYWNFSRTREGNGNKEKEKRKDLRMYMLNSVELCLIGKTNYKLKQRSEMVNVTLRISTFNLQLLMNRAQEILNKYYESSSPSLSLYSRNKKTYKNKFIQRSRRLKIPKY